MRVGGENTEAGERERNEKQVKRGGEKKERKNRMKMEQNRIAV